MSNPSESDPYEIVKAIPRMQIADAWLDPFCQELCLEFQSGLKVYIRPEINYDILKIRTDANEPGDVSPFDPNAARCEWITAQYDAVSARLK